MPTIVISVLGCLVHELIPHLIRGVRHDGGPNTLNALQDAIKVEVLLVVKCCYFKHTNQQPSSRIYPFRVLGNCLTLVLNYFVLASVLQLHLDTVELVVLLALLRHTPATAVKACHNLG